MIRSLNSDKYLISAISMTFIIRYFSIQAERYFKSGDILILISSSGNSQT